MAAATSLRATALHSVHKALRAKMVDFGGWEMPIQYSGILEEHRAVRTAVGLFDVSHMGEIEIRGPQAGGLTDFVTTNHAGKLAPGQVQYSGLLYSHGGFVDDILVHKIADDHYFLCVNAANQEKDFDHIRAQTGFDAQVEFAGDRYAQLAIQGPHALATLQKLTSTELGSIAHYHFRDGEVAGAPARIARTGYTGEDGFECYIPPSHAEWVWNELLHAGAPFGIRPCGLGARNTLRLESAYSLYGHEIDASISPLEAGLAWIVKFDKGDFLGRAALLHQKETGLKRRLFGFEMLGRAIARDGCEVYLDGAPAGWVTSGSPVPSGTTTRPARPSNEEDSCAGGAQPPCQGLNKNIGLCYLPADRRLAPGRQIQILIRGRLADAVIVKTPFYKRPG
ncbi:MAG TPA: glycine cleavage system aminomethyltransferase GcvT [Bryobacteraceae bacterium]|nr:glycine cleavage system aminomethyltransferase GcvT [Bryobacteraceae bacterium]